MATEKETFQIIRDPGPVPQADRGGGVKPKYPFDKIEVGQAFDVPFEGDAKKVRNCLSGSFDWQKHRHGRKFTTRAITREDGVKVIRCWRVA